MGLVNFAPHFTSWYADFSVCFCPGGIIIYSRVPYSPNWHGEAPEVN